MAESLDLVVRRPPVPVDVMSVSAMPSFEQALTKCAEACGSQDRAVALDTGIDNALWTRIKQGEAGIKGRWLLRFMDACGNHLPLFWLIYACGYDPRSLRRLESDVERQNRELREELARSQQELDTIKRFVRETHAGAAG